MSAAATSARPDALLRVSDVTVRFGGLTAIDTVSFEVRQGELLGLIGPNGAGKTTMLRAITGVARAVAGRVELDGDAVFDGKWLRSDLRRLRLDKIGFIFQAHNLLPFLTADENVSVVLDLAGWPAERGRERARELLDYLEVGHRAKVKPALLSGGEAQRVAIARALANRPRIILADEPTAALDSGRAQLVMDLLRKLASDQKACIIAVTHDEKIFDRFDRLIHLRDGRLVDS